MALVKKKQDAIARAKIEIEARKQRRELAVANRDMIEKFCALAAKGLPRLDFEGKCNLLLAMDIRVETDGTEVILSGLISDAILNLTRKQSLEDPDGGREANLCLPYPDVEL
jgi:hypothetical protein